MVLWGEFFFMHIKAANLICLWVECKDFKIPLPIKLGNKFSKVEQETN